MTFDRIAAPLVALLTASFVLSPLASDSFAGFEPTQFPVVAESWPVQPVGWAFSIWGVIYLGLGLSAGLGLLRHRTDPAWAAMRGPLALSLAVGTFGIAVAGVAPVAATAMIVVMAASALAALGRAPAGLAARGAVGLYAGWLTAATGVAVAVVLSGYGLLGAQTAAIVLLGAVLIVALAVFSRQPRAWGYGLGVGWALIGVIAANLPAANLPVIALAGLGIVALGAVAWRGRG